AGGASRIGRAAESLKAKVSAVEEELIQVKAKSRQDTLNYPAKLNLKIGGLAMAVGSADFAPTKAMLDVFEDLSRRADAQLERWSAIARADVPRGHSDAEREHEDEAELASVERDRAQEQDEGGGRRHEPAGETEGRERTPAERGRGSLVLVRVAMRVRVTDARRDHPRTERD